MPNETESKRAMWLRLAEQAARDPSRATQIASVMLDHIDTEARTAQKAPEGYLYSGAHTLIARVRNLEIEPLPTSVTPKAVPIFETSNEAVPIKIPFDIWLYGVAGWAITATPLEDQVPAPNLVANAPSARDGRDLFSVDWSLDGQVAFSTDGRRRKMTPASAAVGTRRQPRALSWTLRRNQVIGVRFRNLWNAIVETTLTTFTYPVLAEAAIAFYVVNLETA